MIRDGAPIGRAIYDEIVALVHGPLVHVLAHVDDVATVRTAFVDAELRVHVRASWVLDPGQVLTLKGSIGALRCPECPPDAGLAELAADIPVRTGRAWSAQDGRASADDFADAMRRTLADYSGDGYPLGPVTP